MLGKEQEQGCSMRGNKPGAKGNHSTGSALTNRGAVPLYPNMVGQSPTPGKATDQIQGVQPDTELQNMCEDPLRDRSRDNYSMAQNKG